VAVKATRTGQLLGNLMRLASRGRPNAAVWEGMTMFADSRVPADDLRLPAVYANFQRNLQDVCAAGLAAGVPVLVCTVASNLRDFAPFASVPGADLTSEQAEAGKASARKEPAGNRPATRPQP